jgi:hypothetical protein
LAGKFVFTISFASDLENEFRILLPKIFVLIQAPMISFTDLFEPKVIQLPLKAGEIVVPEMLWEHLFGHEFR